MLRRHMLAARQALSPAVRRERSEAICRGLLQAPPYEQATHVVAYVPMGAEVDPGAAVAAVVRSGRALYYPCSDGSVAARRAYDASGLPAREGGGREDLLSHQDGRVLVLVPGVAFGEDGARLGRGRGWYDRFLARFDHAHRAGLCFEMQIVSGLPVEPWDVRMDLVVTERRCLAPGRSSGLPEGRA